MPPGKKHHYHHQCLANRKTRSVSHGGGVSWRWGCCSGCIRWSCCGGFRRWGCCGGSWRWNCRGGCIGWSCCCASRSWGRRGGSRRRGYCGGFRCWSCRRCRCAHGCCRCAHGCRHHPTRCWRAEARVAASLLVLSRVFEAAAFQPNGEVLYLLLYETSLAYPPPMTFPDRILSQLFCVGRNH